MVNNMAEAVDIRDAYVGEKRKQIREGFGTYTYENKFFQYEGEWLNGKKHGHGKLSMADGSYYEGEFDRGEINGHGMRYFAMTGNFYSGEFSAGELNGQGVMKYSDGSTYEGTWTDNKCEGYGIFRSTDGSVYQGLHYNNKRHGHGCISYGNIESYEGNWVRDKRQGHGEWRGRNGDIYVGQWMNNMYNGEGKLTAVSGASYEGLWINGQPACAVVKLVIVGLEQSVHLAPGQSFTLSVECHTDSGELVTDDGREIEVIAGVRSAAASTASRSSKSSLSATALFEAIEDVEQQPIMTPLGFEMVRYPLSVKYSPHHATNTSHVDELAGNETTANDSISGQSQSTDAADDKSQMNSAMLDETSAAVTREQADVGTLALQPVRTLRTCAGKVTFFDLVLPAAVPRQAVTDNACAESGQSSNKDEETNAAAAAASNDAVYAQPGEYVIMVQDVTSPPFLCVVLEPAAVCVTVSNMQPTQRTSVKHRTSRNSRS